MCECVIYNTSWRATTSRGNTASTTLVALTLFFGVRAHETCHTSKETVCLSVLQSDRLARHSVGALDEAGDESLASYLVWFLFCRCASQVRQVPPTDPIFVETVFLASTNSTIIHPNSDLFSALARCIRDLLAINIRGILIVSSPRITQAVE